jgi:hypothetical protein
MSAPTSAPEGGAKAASWKQKLQDEATSTGQAGTPDKSQDLGEPAAATVGQDNSLLPTNISGSYRPVGSLLRLQALKLERPGLVKRQRLHQDSSKHWKPRLAH